MSTIKKPLPNTLSAAQRELVTLQECMNIQRRMMARFLHTIANAALPKEALDQISAVWSMAHVQDVEYINPAEGPAGEDA